MLISLVAVGLALAVQPPAPSAAERAMSGAEELIRKFPGQAEPYSNLAKALVRRGRETGDASFLARADKAALESLRIEPENFDGLKARVQIMLGRHEYEAALELAQKLNKRIPDDVGVYG